MPKRYPSGTVTLKDVARGAGVSYQTVSRAVNGFAEVSPETRKRVLRIAERMGYRPNRLAGSLRTKQSKVLGLVMSDIENVFFTEVAGGVEAEATERGYSVILANTRENLEHEQQVVASLLERRVDGLVIAPTVGEHAYLASLLPKKFPVVAINRMIDAVRCGGVMTDNAGGARRGVEYLIGRGHTRIAGIVGSAELMTSRERLQGFRTAMHAASLPVRNEWLAAAGFFPEGGRRAAIKIFSIRERPTAVLTSSSRLTEGVLLGLKELRLRHGHDVEVIGFDDFPWAALLEPPIPVIAQPTHQIGRRAVRMLTDMIAGTGVASLVRLPTRLITHQEATLSLSA
jgi:LacI family transcriptional regulator, galactose operon repressor